MNQEESNTAKIITKKSGAVITIAVILFLVSLVLGFQSFAVIHDANSGIYDSVLRISASSMFENGYYEKTKQRLADKEKRAHVEGFISGGLFITGIILLFLSSRHCSECGTKVAIDTAKKCGSCGSQFT
jgi:hypothetical protein